MPSVDRGMSSNFDKSQTFKIAKKPGKLDKHGPNLVIFSQATGQTWYHTNAYHLSAFVNFEQLVDAVFFC